MNSRYIYRCRFMFLILIILLAGCKTELYTKLSEQEANEMLSLLIESHIHVKKQADKDGLITLIVNESDISQAMSVLNKQGYPKEKFVTMGEVFVKEGMISSPLEERARYNYAISQQLAGTISLIDGVVNARVHVVLPEEDAYGEKKNSPSASVFIKQSRTAGDESLIPKVKMMVANSVEGLSFDDVTVALFQSEVQSSVTKKPMQKVGFLALSDRSVGPFYLLVASLIVCMVAALAACVFMYMKLQVGTTRKASA